jgi:hypothetical protein
MSESTEQPQPPPPPGFPPVVPPSGRYIAQLFIVPGLIVAGTVSVLLFFSWMASSTRTPEGFLSGLRDPNPEIRWRTASDLAQVLVRDDTLASNAEFGASLADLLHDRLPAMKLPPPPATPEHAQDRRDFIVKRNEAQFLTACLGHLKTPAGAKVLCEIAAEPLNPDPKSDALLRRQAVLALAELGYNCRNLPSPPDEVVPTLAKCATAEDPFLRKQAALALSFWSGNPQYDAMAEEALMRLTRDSGQGPRIEITDRD